MAGWLTFSRVNWTTTTVPLWQVDCENYRRTGKPFEIRDVSTHEHREFIEQFAARYDLRVKHGDGVVVFEGTRKNPGKQTTQILSSDRSLSA
jgi:hypothetical protein